MVKVTKGFGYNCPKCSSVITSLRAVGSHMRACTPNLDDNSLQGLAVRCPTCQDIYGVGIASVSHIENCRKRRNKSGSSYARANQVHHRPRLQHQPPPHAALPPQLNSIDDADQHQGRLPVLPDRAMPPVFTVSKSFVPAFRQVTQAFLERLTVLGRQGDIGDEEVKAFLALPDVFTVAKTRVDKGNISRLLELWRSSNPDQLAARVLAASADIRARLPQPASRSSSSSAPPAARLRHLIRNNCPGKAAGLLESHANQISLADLGDPVILEKARALFPEAGPNDSLPEELAAWVDGVGITFEIVQDSLRRLPRQSANGMSSWTYDLIKQVVGEEDEFIQKVKMFSELFLEGKAGSSPIWNSSRAVILRKPDGGLRPIAIGEAWSRVFSRIASAAVMGDLGKKFAPLQWGIGLPGGAEIVAHLCTMYARVVEEEVHPNLLDAQCIQQVDFANAFNSVQRGPILVGLTAVAPRLKTFFRWSYGGASPIYTREGQLLCSSATGVRQGDPLGPLFFCAALQPVLLEVQRRFPTAFLPSYMDDVHVMGRVGDMDAILATIKELAGGIGLAVKESKCLRFCPSLSQEVRESLGYIGERYPEEGLKCLGVPVGTDAYVVAQGRLVLEKFQSILPMLELLEAPVCFPILQACVNARPMYLARTTLPSLISEGLGDFDKRVDRVIGAMCMAGPVLPETASRIRSLPATLGGLSIRKLAPISSIAWSASFAHACFSLYKLAPDLVRRLNVPASPRRLSLLFDSLSIVLTSSVIEYQKDEADFRTFRVWSLDPDAPSVAHVPPSTQRCLTIEFDKVESSRLQGELQDRDKLGAAWVLSNSFRGSTRFLALGENPLVTVTPPAVSSGLRLRLLLSPAAAPAAQGRLLECVECRHMDSGTSEDCGSFDARFHGLVCSQGQAIRLRRHNAIVRAVADFLGRGFGTHKVSIAEEDLFLGNSTHKGDIRIQTAAGWFYLDISVVHPACSKYVNYGSPTSAETALVAAKRMFAKKSEAARRVLNDLPDSQIEHRLLFQAIVFETSGNIHPESVKFLAEDIVMLGLKPNYAETSMKSNFSWLMRRCRTTIAEANHEGYLHFFHQSQLRRQQLPLNTSAAPFFPTSPAARLVFNSLHARDSDEEPDANGNEGEDLEASQVHTGAEGLSTRVRCARGPTNAVRASIRARLAEAERNVDTRAYIAVPSSQTMSNSHGVQLGFASRYALAEAPRIVRSATTTKQGTHTYFRSPDPPTISRAGLEEESSQEDPLTGTL